MNRETEKIKEARIIEGEEAETLSKQLGQSNALEMRQQQAERDLLMNRAWFAGILDLADEAIISIDAKQQITLFNKGAEKIFGYSAAEAIGQSLNILLPERFRAAHQHHIVDFAEAEVTSRLMGERQAIFGRRKNGQGFPAEASISKFELDGEQNFIVVLRDISERKQAEIERETLIAELRALNQAAQAITSELSLERVLQTIVEAAQSLVKVKYAALGVHDGQGYLSRFITAGIDPALHAQIGALPAGRGLLGLILHRGESLIVNDILSHPQAVGFPEQHPEMKSLLGVPLFSKGKLSGALYLADKEDGSELTEKDRELVEMLSLHASIAIENASLYEQTQHLATLEERERFAQDLHDGIIQSVYGVGLALDQVRSEIAPLNQTALVQIDLSIKSLANVIQDIRSYIFDLRPQAMQQKGLKARLEGLIQELKVNIRLPVEAKIAPDIDAYLKEQQARHMFHICHEALSNAARHAKANRISISLTGSDQKITLCIEDDGVGFELPPAINPGHRGLANIQRRVSQLGGILEIDSTPYQGTRLTVTLRTHAQPDFGSL